MPVPSASDGDGICTLCPLVTDMLHPHSFTRTENDLARLVFGLIFKTDTAFLPPTAGRRPHQKLVGPVFSSAQVGKGETKCTRASFAFAFAPEPGGETRKE